MKPLFLLAGLFLLGACTTKQALKNDLARYGYQGDVKRLITFKYINYSDSIPLDSGAFNYRTVYDYTKEGHVSFMQFVLNRSRQNQSSMAVNYTYKIKGGMKTGWQEVNMLSEDTSYGTIEYLDHSHIYERKYSSENQVAYEIITELDSLTYEERMAEIKQYANATLISDEQIINMKAIDGSNYRVEVGVLSRKSDTIWVEILKQDELGNVSELVETRNSTKSKTFIRKEFSYY